MSNTLGMLKIKIDTLSDAWQGFISVHLQTGLEKKSLLLQYHKIWKISGLWVLLGIKPQEN